MVIFQQVGLVVNGNLLVDQLLCLLGGGIGLIVVIGEMCVYGVCFVWIVLGVGDLVM